MSFSFARATLDQTFLSTPDAKRQIIDLLADFSVEVTPATAAKQTALGTLLPRGTRVYIAFVPGEDHRSVVATAQQIRAEGLTPVPHVPARSIVDRATLEDYLLRATGEAGVEEVLVIGGGIDQPVGAFSGTQALLETGLLEDYGIRAIGLAGHPEGQRMLSPPGAATTLEQKFAYAARTSAEVRLVTQFLFEAEPLLAWERALRGHGNTLPIHVGVPGPATVKTLLRYARMCGVGNSMRMLTRQAGSLFKLASVSAPDALLMDLAQHCANDPATRIERLHFYPFGGIARLAGWLAAIKSGDFTLNDDGRGFTVDVAWD
jgi:methylenetetrahydrofolate reductase (NADPH)